MRKMVWIAVGLAFLLVLTTPALWLNNGQYTALATAVQAFGVVVALGLATETLITDSRDKKTDRTLDLHAQLVLSGPLNTARVRLVDHLRKHGSDRQVISVTRDDLTPEKNGRFSAYADGDAIPVHDTNLVLRFFERANAALAAGIIDYPLFHELLAGHAPLVAARHPRRRTTAHSRGSFATSPMGG